MNPDQDKALNQAVFSMGEVLVEALTALNERLPADQPVVGLQLALVIEDGEGGTYHGGFQATVPANEAPSPTTAMAWAMGHLKSVADGAGVPIDFATPEELQRRYQRRTAPRRPSGRGRGHGPR